MAALLCPCALAHVPAPGAPLTPAMHEIVTHARLPAVCPGPWQGPRSSALPENDQLRSPAVQYSDPPAPARLLRAFRAIRATPLDHSPDRLPSTPPWHTGLSRACLAEAFVFSRCASRAVGRCSLCPRRSSAASHK